MKNSMYNKYTIYFSDVYIPSPTIIEEDRSLKEILPNEVFNFKTISRELLDTKIKNEIVTLEVDIDSFSTNILSFKEISKSPESFAQYSPISDFPSSFKDISYSIKDYSKTQELENLLLNYQCDIIKDVYDGDDHWYQSEWCIQAMQQNFCSVRSNV